MGNIKELNSKKPNKQLIEKHEPRAERFNYKKDTPGA